MNVYLTRWRCNNKTAYKIGISKYGPYKLVQERFGDKFECKHQYDLFDIDVMKCIQFSSESYSLARAAALGMEHFAHALCPKDFVLEEHFELDEGTLDGMGGINEFFLMPEYLSERKLVDVFKRAADNSWKLENNLKSFHGTVSAEMRI